MNLPNGFGRLDFSDWLYGLGAAFIGGGAGAVSAGLGVSMLDPKDWNLGTGKLYALVGSVFVINGLLNMMAFLREKPLPDIKAVRASPNGGQALNVRSLPTLSISDTSTHFGEANG
jgi:hypothetical protein